jgi:hypothetical protein
MSLIDFSADEDFNQLSKIQTETKPSNQSNSESINFDLIDIDFKVNIYFVFLLFVLYSEFNIKKNEFKG